MTASLGKYYVFQYVYQGSLILRTPGTKIEESHSDVISAIVYGIFSFTHAIWDFILCIFICLKQLTLHLLRVFTVDYNNFHCYVAVFTRY